MVFRSTDQKLRLRKFDARNENAYTNNRRTVGGNSRGGKSSNGKGSALAKNNGRTAMDGVSFPGVTGEVT